MTTTSRVYTEPTLIDRLTAALAGLLVTRRYRRNYTGKRRNRRTAPANHLLSPAAVQLVTGTTDPVHADGDQDTGLLNVRHIRTTSAFTTTGATR